MLGEELRDPMGLEGPAAVAAGLGLLPVRTTFERDKRAVQVQGHVRAAGFIEDAAGLSFGAYEIHLGTTRRSGCAPFAELTRVPSRGRVLDGAVREAGQVIGTYAHGLFTNEALRTALVCALARRRGSAFTPRHLPSDRYARLSAWFRESVDVPELLAICRVGRRG